MQIRTDVYKDRHAHIKPQFFYRKKKNPTTDIKNSSLINIKKNFNNNNNIDFIWKKRKEIRLVYFLDDYAFK